MGRGASAGAAGPSCAWFSGQAGRPEVRADRSRGWGSFIAGRASWRPRSSPISFLVPVQDRYDPHGKFILPCASTGKTLSPALAPQSQELRETGRQATETECDPDVEIGFSQSERGLAGSGWRLDRKVSPDLTTAKGKLSMEKPLDRQDRAPVVVAEITKCPSENLCG